MMYLKSNISIEYEYVYLLDNPFIERDVKNRRVEFRGTNNFKHLSHFILFTVFELIMNYN